jgi:hypothetical protein
MVVSIEADDLISGWASKKRFALDSLPSASKNSSWVSGVNPMLTISLTSLGILKYSFVLCTSASVRLMFSFALV